MNHYPLTSPQREIWFDQQLHPEVPLYNIGGYIEIKGELDAVLLEQAVNLLIQKHDALRTILLSDTDQDGLPVQTYVGQLRIELPVRDFSASVDPHQAALDWMQQQFSTPFALTGQALFRYDLLKVADDQYYWLQCYHHLIADGWGGGLLSRSLAEIYSRLARGDSPSLDSPSYVDFIEDDRCYVESESFERDRQYWLAQYSSPPEPLFAPHYRGQFQGDVPESGREVRGLNRTFYQRLGHLAKQHQATLFHLLLGALYVYFTRTGQRDDLVIGLPVLNRANARFRNTAGLFVGVNPVLLNFGQDLSFAELLQKINKTLRSHYRHQRFPVSEVNRALGLGGTATRLLDISMSYENLDFDLSFAGLSSVPHPLLHGFERAPLMIFVREFQQREDVVLDFAFNREYFTADEIRVLQSRLVLLLETILEQDPVPIRQLPVVTANEVEQLFAWNATDVDFPRHWVATQLFEAQVAATPDAEAVVFGEERLSYGELNRRANQLSHRLIALGIGPEDRVCLCLERSMAMVVAVWAVMKAGAAYVPIAADLPAARQHFIREDCGAAALLTQASLRVDEPTSCPVIELDTLETGWPEHNPESRSTPDNLAYLIYTSGSTGQPKGVMIEQRALVNAISGFNRVYGVTAHDRTVQLASFAFDVSVAEIFTILCAGGTLILSSREDSLDPERFIGLLGKERITFFGATPLFLSQLQFEREKLPHLRQIFSGGEAISPANLAGLPKDILLVNGYGPTETTIGATAYRLRHTPEEAGRIPIGKPLGNYRVHILDAAQRLLPIGVPGELCIGGVALARGYRNRPELTAEKFMEVELFGQRERIYRTGDRARWLPDGNLEFLGRMDHQIKLRGYRVELGEIEAALAALPGVAETVVVVRGEGAARQLVGYVTGSQLNPAELRAGLKSRLPEYMVPAALVVLERLPLTTNGKVDRKQLPEPDRVLLDAAVTPLEGQTEFQLAALWSELLRYDVNSRSAHFFELGGHSLLATRLASRIRDRFGIDMPLRILFEHPVLGDMAVWIGQQRQDEILPPIVRLADDTPCVLSYAQQRLWFLDQLEGPAATYNQAAALYLRGRLDLPALRQTFVQLQQRHESLHLCFPVNNGEPALRVLSIGDSLVVTDLSALAQDRQPDEVQRRIDAHASQTFDLQNGPLLKLELLILDEQTQVLLLNMHHIISDGWSIGVLLREWKELYGALRQGRMPDLPTANLQYSDYAAWQRRWLQGERLQREIDYWVGQLSGAPQLLELPTDFARPAVQSYHGATLQTRLAPDLGERLKQLSQQQGVTLFMTLFAAFNVLLSRTCDQNDLLIGTPIANRTHGQTENLIGFFVNTLVLRTRIGKAQRFVDVLAQVRQNALDAYAHQDVPFEHLVEALKPARSLSHSPLFQVMFSLQNADEEALTLPGLEVSLQPSSQTIAKFDLSLGISESAQGLVCGWEFCTALFEPATIGRMAERFEVLLQQLVAAPEAALDGLNVLTGPERQLLQDWNATAVPVPEVCIQQLFEAQVAATPEGEAVVFGQERLSYGELNRRANQLAHRLIALGIGPEDRVCICLERSLAMVVAVWAVLKAGAAYVPIASDLPAERQRFIREDCAAAALLTQASLRVDEPSGCPVIALDTLENDWPEDNPESRSIPDNLAYLIYTSGSTGLPKGVLIEQRALVNAVTTFNRVYGVTSHDRTAQLASFAFDVSVSEIFSILCAGGTLVIPERDDLFDPERFQALLAEERITFFGATPLFLSQLHFDRESLPHLRQIFSGGEAISPANLAGIAPDIPIVNGYGPTEATIGATAYRLRRTAEEAEGIPIGKPLANYRVHILDAAQRLLPIGVPGELCIGGIGLARGYRNRPELTAEKFIEVELFGQGERIYRTGDRARWRADGNLEFLGRFDHQIKLRGFRIELGEIEAALAALPGVGETVVVVRGEGAARQLVGYVTGTGLNPTELRAGLKSRLPEYMVPAALVVLEGLPRTANGKVDRTQLPEPEMAATSSLATSPRDALEEIVAGLWAVVLDQPPPGRYDNFFELGGHSMLATRLAARLREALQLPVPVRWLFEWPTVAGLATRLRQALAGETGEAGEAPPVSVPANRILPGVTRITPDDLPLIVLSQDHIDGIVRTVEGGVGNIQDIYPLTPLQEGILFHHLLQPASDPYLSQVQLAFDSLARCQAFIAALQTVTDRHDVLRTAVVWEQLPEPVQVVWRSAPIPVEIRRFDATQGSIAGQLHADCQAHAPLDLTRAPMRRIVLAEDGNRVVMSLIGHHLTVDHTTLDVLLEEVAAILRGEAALLPPPVPYRNFVAQMRLGVSSAAHEAFFRDMLGSIETPTAPFGLLDVQGDGSDSLAVCRDLPPELALRLRTQARRSGVTPASLFHLAFALLLSRFCNQKDVVFGTVLFGRLQGGEGVERALGLFINTLPLRIDCDARPVAAALRETQHRMLALMRHEHASLSLAQRCSAIPAAADAPLFSALLNYRHGTDSGGTDVHLEGVELLESEGRTNYPFVMSVDDLGEGFGLSVGVDAAIDPNRVYACMQRALEMLATALEQAPQTPLCQLDILPLPEQQTLQAWNATAVDFPRHLVATELFESQAAATPGAEALVFGEERLSYGELNRRANQLAHRLIGLGVGPEDRVCICVERSPAMVVAALAVLKAGAAYVPIAADLPAERQRFIREDSGAAVLLTQGSLISEETPGGPVINLDTPETPETDWPEHNPEVRSTPDNLAYLIYTSGSTGQPKGVMIEQRALVNTITAFNRVYGVTPHDRTVQIASFAFDVSVAEIFPILCAGGTLAIPCRDDLLDPARFLSLLGKERITFFGATPLFLSQLELDRKTLPHLRQIFSGGEAISQANLAGIAPDIPIVNGYGPTEATIGATAYRLRHTPEEAERIPIGKPLSNYRLFVLDAAQQSLPIGVPGELCIGGIALARGYLNRPELTAEKFIEVELFGQRERIYRTGDRARWLPDGNLEFLGRMDHQIKLRGFRIELGEIEAALAALPGVAETVVITRGEGAAKQLVGYVTGNGLNPTDLRAGLKSRLPDYMVPASLVVLERLPLTTNGKVDRKQLPEPDSLPCSNDLVPPRNTTELLLAQIWEETLGVSPIGVTADFFALGGHSLLAVRLMNRIHQHFERALPLASLFQCPTIAQLARLLEENVPASHFQDLVPIQPKGKQVPLYLLPGAGGHALYYYALSAHLGSDQPVYGLETPGLYDEAEIQGSVEQHAAHLLRTLRQHRCAGPYRLAGHSAGGLVAFELARQLEAQGETVQQLIVLDAAAPDALSLPPLSKREALRDIIQIVESLTNATLGLSEELLDAQTDEECRYALVMQRLQERDSALLLGSLRQIVTAYEAMSRNQAAYQPRGGVRCPITLVQAESTAEMASLPDSWGWQAFTTTAVRVIRTPGAHLSMLTEPNVRSLAKLLMDDWIHHTDGKKEITVPVEVPDCIPEAETPLPDEIGGHAKFDQGVCIESSH